MSVTLQANSACKENLPIPLCGPNSGDGQIFFVRVRFFSSQESTSSSVSEQTVRILYAGEKKIYSLGIEKKEVREQKNSENTTHKKKLLRIYHNIIMYDTEENDVPHQKMNGYDCAVSCMLAYYFVTNSLPLLFCQVHIGMCQNRLALALLSVVT